MTLAFHLAFREFEDGTHDLSGRSWVMYLGDVRSFKEFIGADVPLSDIQLSDFLDWIEHLSVGEAAVARKFYALRYFFEYTTGSNPFGDWRPTQRSSGDWTTPPTPQADLDKLAGVPRLADYYGLRSRAVASLAWDRFFAREAHWMILDDLNIEMGLARCERGLFSLSGLTRRFLAEFLEARRQYGNTPILFTGKGGKPIAYDFFLSAFSDYTAEVTGKGYTMKNIAAARFLNDYQGLMPKANASSRLAIMWGRPQAFVRSVLGFFSREGYINA